MKSSYRRSLRFPLAAVLLMLIPVLAAQTIEVGSQSEVQGERIRLSDIAVIEPHSDELASVSLGNSPAAGHHRWIARSEIESALRGRGLDLQLINLRMDAKVLVTRVGQMLEAARLEAEIRTFFALHPLGYRADTVETPSGLSLPLGDLEIRIEDPGPRLRPGEISLKVTLLLDGRFERSLWARVRLSRIAEVLVALRDLSAGTAVGPDDVTVQELSLERPGDYLESRATLQGMVARRTIRAGHPLSTQDLRMPDAVRRGDIVKLTAVGDGVSVSTLGKARAGGTLGETVAVENLNSRTIVQAVVVGDKQVQVTLSGGQ